MHPAPPPPLLFSLLNPFLFQVRWGGPQPGYGIFEDLDGTLAGAAGSFVTADWPHLHTPGICTVRCVWSNLWSSPVLL
jgi:hypothetical protein